MLGIPIFLLFYMAMVFIAFIGISFEADPTFALLSLGSVLLTGVVMIVQIVSLVLYLSKRRYSLGFLVNGMGIFSSLILAGPAIVLTRVISFHGNPVIFPAILSTMVLANIGSMMYSFSEFVMRSDRAGTDRALMSPGGSSSSP